ncbi:MAG: acyl carrier protein [Clostridia bacterium]|nr:acyl carrier protein [Clostridia bacterium]
MAIDKIKKVLSRQLNITEDKIKPESKLVEDLGADSLDMVEMLMTLEDQFGITISDEEAVNIKTVSDITKFIK